MSKRSKHLPVCSSKQLAEKAFILLDMQYRGRPCSCIVFRFRGKVFAYLNQCVHMPRRLDCERDTIFDAQRELLRCSMHGIVYAPETGESLSTMCQGKRLQAVGVQESDGRVSLHDKHVAPADRDQGPRPVTQRDEAAT
ncbi:MAG TPA: Rieske 2Fe-2S domain-containing protein [Gammaproteobacteria bacterium]|nr:Rieske 2Fe-2S domain-containing protein [Gammaproteobacteria bacterium]